MKKPKAPACTVCGKPAVERFRPFCSARCAEVDLGRWFGEAYRVPAGPADEPPDAPPGDEPADDDELPG